MNIKAIIQKIKNILFKNVTNLHYTLEGRYEFTIIKPNGHSEKIAEFSNLITNAGLNRIGSGQSYLSYIHLGSGATAPAFTDSALAVFVASSSVSGNMDFTVGNASVPPYFTQIEIVKRFNAGVATGNLSEVGVSWSDVTGSLFSRALILDSSGNPTTITKLADEILDVKYILRVNIPMTDITSTINGYSTVTRALNVLNTNAWGAYQFRTWDGSAYATQTLSDLIETNIVGQSYSMTSNTFDAYINNSYSITGTLTFSLERGNSPTGIGSITYVAGFGLYQTSFTPVILKDNTKSLSITYSVSWARA
jgi:hypothetical protein